MFKFQVETVEMDPLGFNLKVVLKQTDDNLTSKSFYQVGKTTNNTIELDLLGNSDFGFEQSSMSGLGDKMGSVAMSTLSVGVSIPKTGINTSFSYTPKASNTSLSLTTSGYSNEPSSRRYTRHILASFSKQYVLTNSNHYYHVTFRIRNHKTVKQSGSIRARFNLKFYHTATGHTDTAVHSMYLYYN